MIEKTNCKTFLDTYRRVMASPEVSARGLVAKEARNILVTIDPTYPITSFRARKFNLSYAKKELLWYLRGDRYDTSICDEAGAWNTLIQPDGGINSNYGQVIFSGPKLFDWVVEELARDPSSRRAVIVLGDANMLTKENKDHRCTMYISYHIRDMQLHQTVHMRSNDVVFGLTNDVFFYGYLHQMMLVCLRVHYPTITLGKYVHIVDSLHVYQRHFGMLEKILLDGEAGWYDVAAPTFSCSSEVFSLRNMQDRPSKTKLVNWLLEEKNAS